MKRKIIFINLGIISIIAISVIIMVIRNNNHKFNYEIEKVNNINYVLINENNKFGVINKNGDVVVKPIYDEIDIPNPSKPVFICMYNFDEQKNQYSIKVLNDKSEQILYEYVVVEAIKLNPAINEIPYEKSVLKFMKDGKYGLIDFQGKIIAKPKYEEIRALDYKEGLLLVKKSGKYGVININGHSVIKEKYDIIECDGYYETGAQFEKAGFIVGNKVNDDYEYGYVNYKGEQILKNKYNQIYRIQNINKNDDVLLIAFENNNAGLYKNKERVINHEYEDILYNEDNNCLILQKNFKQGISDLNGNIVKEIKYDNIFISGKYVNMRENENIEIFNYETKQNINMENSDLKNAIGLNETTNNKYSLVITNNEKYKVLNNETTEVSNKEFDYIEYIYDNFFIVYEKEKYGVIDENGNYIIKPKYNFLFKIENSKMLQGIIENTNTTEILSNNKIIMSMKNSKVNIHKDYIQIISDNKLSYLDYEGNIVENSKILPSKLFSINENGKFGFKNSEGKIVIQPQYDLVTEFNKYGFAGIKKNGKWGCVNLNGEIVVEPTYTINSNNPNFIGKYYECNLEYGTLYFICEK